MKKLHSFFLFIFLCSVLLLPAKAEARKETLQEKLKMNTTPTGMLKCSEIFSICAEGPKNIIPVVFPIPTSEPTKPVTPTPTTRPRPPSLDSDAIFTLINDHRKNIGLPVFEKEERLCKLAESRGPELYEEIYVTGDIHGGFRDRLIPYWMTENMVSQPTVESAFAWWMRSSLHRSAIEGDYKYSCGTCYGNSCAQLFTNYLPK